MLLYLFMLIAHADDEPTVIYKKKTEIDFEGVEVEGELVKPQTTLTVERRRASFNPFLQIRKDFDKEMHNSVREIK